MTSPLSWWAAKTPDRVWLAERSGEGWRTLTFGEAHERVSALAGGLREIGVVGPGPLLILARNSIDHALVAYAAMSQGVPVAPVSHRYGMPDANLTRLVRAVDKVQPAAVYVEDAELFARGLSIEALTGLPVIAGQHARPGDVALARLWHATPAGFIAEPQHHARYLLTSGSTGQPKAVICSHAEVSLNVAQVAACFNDPEPPVMLHSAPWSHSMGLSTGLHQSLLRGGTLYIDCGQPTAERFGETVRNLKSIEPTYHNMVPAGFMLLADALEQDPELARSFFARMRLLQYGGAALGQTIADRIQAVAARTVGARISFASAYGSTETGPIISNVHWVNGTMGLIGLPIPGTEVKLTLVDGKYELRARGPQISQGYLGEPDLSAAARDEEGFFRLGDAVRLVDPEDPAQGLCFDGRLSENFKLASGTFVTLSEVRLGAIGAIGHAVTDAVVCGEGQAGIGLLLYPNPELPRAEVEAAVRAGLERFNTGCTSNARHVARAMVLSGPPDPNSGEITDKGYIAQRLAREHHADAVRQLFAETPPAEVMVFA